jgi:hypothetical protein
MKKILLSLTLILSLANFNQSKAIIYNGNPIIFFHGPFATAQRGTLYCTGSMMALCCDINGSSIYIFGWGFAELLGTIPLPEETGSQHEFDNLIRIPTED